MTMMMSPHRKWNLFESHINNRYHQSPARRRLQATAAAGTSSCSPRLNPTASRRARTAAGGKQVVVFPRHSPQRQQQQHVVHHHGSGHGSAAAAAAATDPTSSWNPYFSPTSLATFISKAIDEKLAEKVKALNLVPAAAGDDDDNKRAQDRIAKGK